MSKRVFKKSRQGATAQRSSSAAASKPDSLIEGFLRHSFKFKLFLLVIATFTITIGVVAWFLWSAPILSPLSSVTRFQFLRSLTQNQSDRIVYGFLPYWNLDEVALQPELTHLAYFSVTIDAAGNLITRLDGGAEPGYRNLNSEVLTELNARALEQNTQLELVLTQFNKDDAVAFLRSEDAQQTLLDSLDSVLLAYPVSGINIDIELSGELPSDTKDNLTAFVERLRTHLDTTYDDVQLSIDTYAGAASGSNLWDIAALEPNVDYFVVMAYDFHRRSSPVAGPVAPLFGGDELWASDINQHLQEFLAVVPSSKLLLGVPFYGYQWQTTSRDSQATTFPSSGSTATVSRVVELLEQREELQLEERWSEEALSPYLIYEEDGQIYQIYYENARSLSYKLDYVNQLDLAGIAIWALGYEGDSRELWDEIEQKL